MTTKYEAMGLIKNATKALKQNFIKDVNIIELNRELRNLFTIHLPDASFKRTVTDYDVKTVTDYSKSHRVGNYTVYGKKEIRTEIGSHVEEDLGAFSTVDRDTAFALFEECIRYASETGDDSVAPIIEAFTAWGHYWSQAAEMAEKIKPLIEQKQRELEAKAVELQSQDMLDFKAFIETGILPKWFLLEDAVYPETVTASFKRLPGELNNMIINDSALLCSKEFDGDMSILIRSIVFDAAPASKHWSETADPYLKIWGSNKAFHLEKPLKTSIINNTLTPAWKDLNLTFESRATLAFGSESESVVIEVWNDNRFKDTMMASAVIDCSHLAALGLRRLRSLNNPDVTRVDLVVRVDFSYATTVKKLIPPTRYGAIRSINDRRVPEKREAILDVQLTFGPGLIAALFKHLGEKVY